MAAPIADEDDVWQIINHDGGSSASLDSDGLSLAPRRGPAPDVAANRKALQQRSRRLEHRLVASAAALRDTVTKQQQQLSAFVGDMDGVLTLHKDTSAGTTGIPLRVYCIFV